MLSDDGKTLIIQTLEKAIANKELAGANMMIIKDEEEVFYHEAGFANVGAGKPIKRDTLFRLYSMTKPITAVAVIKLMEQGEIDLFDQVDKYLPGFKNQKVVVHNKLVTIKRPMIVRDLLNMTSGLLYGGDEVEDGNVNEFWEALDDRLLGDMPMTTFEVANTLGRIPLAFHPGEAWNYGTSADVLGAIVEVVSGKSFREFLKYSIFRPLDMNDTDFFVPLKKRERLAVSYERIDEDGKVELIPYVGNYLGINNAMNQKPLFESGGAGLVSTIDDYAKFTKMLLAKGTFNGIEVLKEKSVEFLTSSKLTDLQQSFFDNKVDYAGHTYGNLMRVVSDTRQTGIFSSHGEYGWAGWLGTYFANCPVDDLTILFMMQTKEEGTVTIIRKLRNIIMSEMI